MLNFAVSVEDNDTPGSLPEVEAPTAAALAPPAAADSGGGWGWGGLSSMMSSVATGTLQ